MGQTYDNRKPYRPLTEAQIASDDWIDYTRPLPPMPDMEAFQALLNDDCTLMFREDEAHVIIFLTNGENDTTLFVLQIAGVEHVMNVKGGLRKVINGFPFDLHRFRFMTYEDMDKVEAEVDRRLKEIGGIENVQPYQLGILNAMIGKTDNQLN